MADAVAGMPGVVVQAHWQIGSQTDVNGSDFYVGEEELGHIHLDGEAHVPLGAAVVKALVKARLARRFRWSDSFAAVDAHDVDGAPLSFEASGFHARVIQHEYDHLDGILFVDRMTDMSSLTFEDEWDEFGTRKDLPVEV